MKRFTSFAIAIAVLAQRDRPSRSNPLPSMPRAPGHRRQAGDAHVSAGPQRHQGTGDSRAGAARHDVRRLARAAPRRSGVARAREEPRHPGREARAAIGGFPGCRVPKPVSAGARLHRRPARSVPVADAHHQRRHPRQQGDDDLQLVDDAGTSASSAAATRVTGPTQRVASSDTLATRQPAATPPAWSRPTRSRCCAASRSTTSRQQLLINLINREISEESARATVTQTLANVRNAYWDLVFAQSAVDVAQRAHRARRQAGRRQPGARRSRHARAARHRAGAGGSGDAPAEPGRRRSRPRRPPNSR